jgi:hypothetical protein
VFAQSWPWTLILLLRASHVVGIIDAPTTPDLLSEMGGFSLTVVQAGHKL